MSIEETIIKAMQLGRNVERTIRHADNGDPNFALCLNQVVKDSEELGINTTDFKNTYLQRGCDNSIDPLLNEAYRLARNKDQNYTIPLATAQVYSEQVERDITQEVEIVIKTYEE